MKANRALGFVRRHLRTCTAETKLKCYTTLVRPILEYASVLWDPHLASHIHILEMVQRRAVRFISNDFHRDSSVTAMLKNLKITSLAERRKIGRLLLFYKIDQRYIPLVPPAHVVRKKKQGRLDNGMAYDYLLGHSNPFYSSFYPKTIREWNKLPNQLFNVDHGLTCDSFYSHLVKFFE